MCELPSLGEFLDSSRKQHIQEGSLRLYCKHTFSFWICGLLSKKIQALRVQRAENVIHLHLFGISAWCPSPKATLPALDGVIPSYILPSPPLLLVMKATVSEAQLHSLLLLLKFHSCQYHCV